MQVSLKKVTIQGSLEPEKGVEDSDYSAEDGYKEEKRERKSWIYPNNL